MTWTEAFASYYLARSVGDQRSLEQITKNARRLLSEANAEVWQQLEEALSHQERKWLVAAIFSKARVPNRLLHAMLRAAVYEADPSFNRCFVEPCIASHGHRVVVEALLEVVENGNDFEKAGAVNALYWGGMSLSFPAGTQEFTLENATPESRSAYVELEDVWDRKRCLFLRVFVSNENVHVRQSIIPSLDLTEWAYPDELKPLIGRAIRIARSHEDDYIRHRVEVQLGNERLLFPLPHRRAPE
jgi:hypothetical protein